MLAVGYARIAVGIQARGWPVIIQLVRFASRLSYDEVMERFEARSDRYREVPGLLQKYYVHYAENDEYGGVYVWDSEDSLQKWRETNLSGTLADTYQVKMNLNASCST
jgi:Putative mono-oxygenase ydhR